MEKAGRIVSFYSYKGGTGRTMALTNIAWVLASNGCDVLVIDWDLEAPGLHRYLRPFLIDRELTATPGVIDFVWDCAQASMTSTDGDAPAVFPTLEDYTVGLDWDFGARGSISFIPAGRQDDNYAQRVNTFNWDNFYERLGGGKILETERQRMRAAYDYVLIDSRTGVSDTASVCTVQMPDTLLVFFTLNRQSIEGTAAIAHSIRSSRPDIAIFPVPTRIENSETDKRDAAFAYARRIFAPLLLHVQTQRDSIDPKQQAKYWNKVETPYRPYYAFEEVPAVFKDEPGSRNSVLAPNERIASLISGESVSSHNPVSEARRTQVVNAFAFADNDNNEFRVDRALENPVVERAVSTAIPTDRPVSPAPAPAPKADRGPMLWKLAAAALVVAVVVLGIEWRSTADQLATRNRLVATQAGQLDQFRQTASDSLDRLADAATKLNFASKQTNSRIVKEKVDDAIDTVRTLQKQLRSVP
jgi:MinD-like ATPase involved in chromosome partitioning or flagellar assembly